MSISFAKTVIPTPRTLWGRVWHQDSHNDSNHRHWRTFALLLVTFVCNTILWGIIVQPMFPPDEMSHFEYIRHLYETQTLPVYGETYYIYNTNLLNAHALIPPLYYLLGVPLLASAADQNLETQVVVVRILSLLIGTGIVTIAYLLGRMLVPARPHFALVFAALVGFNPRFTYMSAAINSDNLVNLIAAALLLTLIYGIKQQSPTRRWMVTMGSLMGLGLITKQTIAVVIIASGVMILWLVWQQPKAQRVKTFVTMAVWMGSSMLLISGWFFVRNWLVYGDLTGLSLIGSQDSSYTPYPYTHFSDSFLEMLFATSPLVIPFFPTMFRSFWEYFDHVSIKVPQPIFWLFFVLTIGGGVGTLLWLVRQWRQRSGTKWQRASVASIALFIGLILASVFSACYRMDYQPQGRYLFTALLPLMLVMLVGWESLAGMLRVRHIAAPLIIAAVFVANIATLITTIAPAHHFSIIKKQTGILEFPGASLHIRPIQLPQLVFGPFGATYQFVPQSTAINRFDLLLETTPDIHGPVIWHITDQQQNELAHGVDDFIHTQPSIPTLVGIQPQVSHYTLAIPQELRFQTGEPYVLSIHAPRATVETPLRVYQSAQDGAPPEVVNNSRLLELHVGYADKPLDTLLYTISHRFLTDSPQSPLGMAQLALYVLVSGQMIVLVFVVFGGINPGIPRTLPPAPPSPLSHKGREGTDDSPSPLGGGRGRGLPEETEGWGKVQTKNRRMWQIIATIGVVLLAVWLFQAEPPKHVPREIIQAEPGQLLTLDTDIVADLLFLANSPSTLKDPPAPLDMNQSSAIQPFTFTLAHKTTPVLFMHATSTITYTFTDLPSDTALKTAFTINPLAWDLQEQGVASDGAEFVVSIQREDETHEVVRRFIDPVHNQRDRRWYPVEVDLSAYAGERVQLVLSVLPGPDGKAHFDWGGWRQPVLVPNDTR